MTDSACFYMKAVRGVASCFIFMLSPFDNMKKVCVKHVTDPVMSSSADDRLM